MNRHNVPYAKVALLRLMSVLPWTGCSRSPGRHTLAAGFCMTVKLLPQPIKFRFRKLSRNMSRPSLRYRRIERG